MGSVYLAQHAGLGRGVAGKGLRRELSEDESVVGRFLDEAKATAAIHHPSIVEVFDVGRLPSGLPYLTMELLEGESLQKRLERERRLTVDAACTIVCQAA